MDEGTYQGIPGSLESFQFPWREGLEPVHVAGLSSGAGLSGGHGASPGRGQCHHTQREQDQVGCCGHGYSVSWTAWLCLFSPVQRAVPDDVSKMKTATPRLILKV